MKKTYAEFLDEVTKLGCRVCGTDEHFRKFLNEYSVRLDDYPINLVVDEDMEGLKILQKELLTLEEKKFVEFKTYL